MTNTNQVHELDTAKVGDGATFTLYTDSNAATIIARTATTITLQFDKAELLNGFDSGEEDALQFAPGGFVGHTSGRQRWAHERDPEGRIVKVSRRVLRNGAVRWVQVGHGTRSPGCSATAGRHHFHDFNF